jgi:hypothetical protein
MNLTVITPANSLSAPSYPVVNDSNAQPRVLWIGSHEKLDDQVVGFRNLRSVEPHLYTPYAPPPQALLEHASVVWVFDVELPARFRQLQFCCAYARRTGANLLVFAVSCLFNAELRRRENSELAKRALNIGARILPQFSRS